MGIRRLLHGAQRASEQREFDYQSPVSLSVRYGNWTRLGTGGVREVSLWVGITQVSSLTEEWDEHLDTWTTDRTAELVRRWLAAPSRRETPHA